MIGEVKKILSSFILLALLIPGPVAHAQGQEVDLSESQLTLITQNCTMTQGIIERVRSNDALTRRDIGYQYESIATKLMAPMNGRIALNGLDGVELQKTTIDFNKALDSFRKIYISHDQAEEKALQIDCRKKASDFYAAIGEARQYRQQVSDSVIRLQELVAQYRMQIDTFADKLSQGATK